ncbi:LpxI family protein [Alsobacter sp. R-9]
MAAAPPGPVAIVAGGGAFPLEVADAAAASGRKVAIVALRGFAARSLGRHDVRWADMLDPVRVLDLLRQLQPACVVLAGAVTRPGPFAITSVFAAYRNREDLGRILAAGDDRILRGVVDLIEEAGFPVVGPQAVAPGLLAGEGPLGRLGLSPQARADAQKGLDLLAAIGPFDVGQAVVVSGGRVLAVEGPEGTDGMLDRVASLQRWRRVRLDGRGGVLVKAPKPGQDWRIDLPAVGPRTIRRMKAAGLDALAVAAGGVFTVDRAAMVAAADRAGIAIEGIGVEDAGS